MLDARDLKAHADFVAIVSRYTRLRRAGRQYVGLCPFHSERDPSLYVEPVRKIWKCFACEAGGDLFAFVMRAEDCEFRRALEIVAQLAPEGARESEPQSGERFRAGRGLPPPAAKRPGTNSQSSEVLQARLLDKLEATTRRLALVNGTNRAASRALATPCEPDRYAPLLENTGQLYRGGAR
jgi:hypothetical protein